MFHRLVLLSLLSSSLALRAGNRKLSKAEAEYEFDCGYYGKGSVEIEDGEMSFKCNLKNIDELTAQSELSYHLHTIWINEEDFSTTTCGSPYTGLHYDPTFQCGPASEARGLGLCDTPYVCDSFETCEVGDLSGKWGNIAIDSKGKAKTNESGDTFPADPTHFVEDNTVKDPALFSSIVFHEGIGGARVLCCKLVSDDDEDNDKDEDEDKDED